MQSGSGVTISYWIIWYTRTWQAREAVGNGDDLHKPLSPDAVYQNTIRYAKQAGIPFRGLSPHALRATAATTALEKGADIAKVQDWLGHANVSTTRPYLGCG